MRRAVNELRLLLAELLMRVQLWLAPDTPEGEWLITWIGKYAEISKAAIEADSANLQ